MAFVNPSFESADSDTVAWAANWTEDFTSTLWDTRKFGEPYLVPEGFEYGWSSNEDSLSLLTDGVTTALRAFDSGAGENWEDFEEEWSSNEDWASAWYESSAPKRSFDTAGEDVEDFEEEWGARHLKSDANTATATIIDSTPVNVHTRLNQLKALHNVHIASTTFHINADITNTISSADATDLATSNVLMNELWTDIWAHITDATLKYHIVDELSKQSNPGASLPPTSYSECAMLASLLTVYYNQHLDWPNNSGVGYTAAFEDFSPTPSDIYGLAVMFNFDSAISSEAYEDHEEGWYDNQSSIASLTDGVTATLRAFTISGGTENWDDFEETFTMTIATASTTAGSAHTLEPTQAHRIAIAGTLVSSELWIQTRQQGSSTWVTKHIVTSVSVDCDLEDGFEEVRIWTETWGSGSPTAELEWRPLESY